MFFNIASEFCEFYNSNFYYIYNFSGSFIRLILAPVYFRTGIA